MNIIMDIKEATEKMTKDEFLKSAKETCIKRYGINVANEDCEGVKCEDCRKEQIKGIKFKGEEETFEVECIKAEGKVCLTKGKIYSVKQSKEYDNYYELINDSGAKEVYFKSRFKVVENKKTWGERFYESKGKEIVEEIIKEVVEGEKVEEVIKVRCIKNEKLKLYLTIDKEYKVIAVNRDGYHIEDDTGNEECYLKEYFEKVTDDILIVECIDNLKNPLGNGLNLTIGKKYKVIENGNEEYLIENDKGNKNNWYLKKFFKPVEPQKEENKKYYIVDEKGKEVRVDKGEIIEEYSVMELFEEKEGIEYKIEGLDNLYKIENGILRRSVDKGFYETMYCDREILKAKFTKVEEPKEVTLESVMKVLENLSL